MIWAQWAFGWRAKEAYTLDTNDTRHVIPNLHGDMHIHSCTVFASVVSLQLVAY
jgi:hypothetical protein